MTSDFSTRDASVITSAPPLRSASDATEAGDLVLNSRANPGLRYAVAIFLSSLLLFLIEPIAGKRILPLLGGSAAVWTACLVFFQSALLVGYLAAHWLVTRTSARVQGVAYVALLGLSIGQLAFALSTGLGANPARPITSVLWMLTVLIGLPFVTLSITSPLLQSWYAGEVGSQTTIAAQPYRLFAVSNVGSLLALVVYPLLIEPRLSLRNQTAILTAGFVLLTAVCGAIAYSIRNVAVQAMPTRRADSDAVIVLSDRLLWVALAACGSLLLSAVTSHISQNVATVPLLWVAPLIAYLLSFVVAFSGERWRRRRLMIGLALVGMGSAGYLLYTGILGTPIVLATAIFCVALFLLCFFLHSELYRRRPPSGQLTTFYLCVAAGGAVGAILIGVIAPSILPGNYEFACGLFFAAALGLTVTWADGRIPRFAWLVAMISTTTIGVVQVLNDRVNTVRRVRNFYGTLHVTQGEALQAQARTLYNGVIMHGRQVFRTDLRATPTTYYGHPSGVGLALDLCCANRPRRVGVVGLGTGTIAAFGRAGDVFRFYDINPAVEGIARRHFAYLRDSPARIDIVIGDARLSLAGEPPQHYDVIAVDAFSGDAIPVHLITAEALEVYRRHLAPGGIVAFHVSNRYLDLKPVVQQLADRAGMKTAYISNDEVTATDVWSSDWILVTTNESFLTLPAVDTATDDIKIPPRLRPWTDDWNSLLPILKWRR